MDNFWFHLASDTSSSIHQAIRPHYHSILSVNPAREAILTPSFTVVVRVKKLKGLSKEKKKQDKISARTDFGA